MSVTDTFSLNASPIIRGDALFARHGTARRQIRRWWVAVPTRWVAWLMLNPSDAGWAKNDPTALRVTNFTRSWGYDGWIGVNVYPFIASNPRDMWQRTDWASNGPDWEARDDMQSNLADIEAAARASCLRMAAFGAAPGERDQPWLEQCLERFSQPGSGHDGRLLCLGKTLSGQPLHPLARGKHRVPDSATPMVWRECRPTPESLS